MLILVDSCVWINHLNRSNKTLTGLLNGNQVLIHPFVIGELVCGGIDQKTFTILQDLPKIKTVADAKVINFIRQHRKTIYGGYIDMHLLLSAKLAQKKLWTVDKKLHTAAQIFNLNY